MAGWEEYQGSRYIGHRALCSSKSGQVVTAVDKVTGEKVIMKRVAGLSKQVLREVKLARLLNHENILVPEAFHLQGSTLLKVYPHMDSDLSHVIHRVNDQQCQFFLYQLLRGLKYLHGCGLAHRSISPAHLLINSNCELKVGHLETATHLYRAQAPLRLPETQRDRWYLSPERLLGKSGSREDDMWAVGCVLGEMLAGRVLFEGETAGEQLREIVSVVEGPGECDLEFFESVFTVEALKHLSKVELNRFSLLFCEVNPLARSLLSSLLAFNPSDRFSVAEALEHEYLSDFHDSEDEPTGEGLQPELWEGLGDVRKEIEEEKRLWPGKWPEVVRLNSN